MAELDLDAIKARTEAATEGPWEVDDISTLVAYASMTYDKMWQVSPPPGWFTFGTHIDAQDVAIEFWGEGEDGLPIWERPVVAATDERVLSLWETDLELASRVYEQASNHTAERIAQAIERAAAEAHAAGDESGFHYDHAAQIAREHATTPPVAATSEEADRTPASADTASADTLSCDFVKEQR